MKKTLSAFIAVSVISLGLMIPAQTAQAESCRSLAAKLGIKPKALNAYIAKCKKDRAKKKSKGKKK